MPKPFNGERIIFLTHIGGTTRYPYTKEWSYTSPQKWTKDLNTTAKNIRRKHRGTSLWFCIDNNSDITQTTHATKEKR